MNHPVLHLLRPKQWTKNLLVFAALIFSGQFLVPSAIALAFQAFLAMAAISSAAYILNDLRDVQQDRNHPTKRHRPLASGAVTARVAWTLFAILLVGGILLTAALGTSSLIVLGAYLALQLAYNFGLKQVAIADVYCIATGFVLRAAFGATAIDVRMSGWFLFCTGALALMLAFAKRRHEFILQGPARETSRESLKHYNRPLLDALVVMMATSAALCYGVYSLDSSTAQKYPAIVFTSPFVFYGITRYVFLVFTMDEGGEPADILLHDKHIIFCVLGFVVVAMAAIFANPISFLE